MLSSLPLRMPAAIGGVLKRISGELRLPSPELGSRCWQMMARRLSANCVGSPPGRSAGRIGVAPDRSLRVAGVQRRKDDMPGFGRVEGHLHSIAVADLADEHHVGVLSSAYFNPSANERTSGPTSRWVMIDLLAAASFVE